MIVRVEWYPRSWDAKKSYHVYECTDYFIEINGWSGGSNEPSIPSGARLMLDGGKHDIALDGGDAAYFMTPDGKTFDSLKTYPRSVSNSSVSSTL
jgi:hypothetical protein